MSGSTESAGGSERGAPRPCRGLFGGTRGEIAATAATLIVLLLAVYLVCREVDAWAATAFARPMMASALLAVCDVAILLVALCLAPPLSKLLHLPLDAKRKRTNGSPRSARGCAGRERASGSTQG